MVSEGKTMGTINVLIADEVQSDREKIKYILRDYQATIEVMEAANKKSAMQIIRDRRVDILFTNTDFSGGVAALR